MRLILLLLVAGCRFGGPTGVSLPDAGPPIPAMNDAAPDSPAPSAPSDAADAPASDGCAPPFAVMVCDPVCNTGCPALSRCDVTDMLHTGACVGIWIGGEGQACFKGSGTDACAPKLTCVEGTCRRLCYTDAQCPPPSCCHGTLPSGFATCSACR